MHTLIKCAPHDYVYSKQAINRPLLQEESMTDHVEFFNVQPGGM
jgi:hypothetical protein